MTAFGSTLSSTSAPITDPRPRAEVIPIGGRPEPVLVSLTEAAAAAPASERLLWVEYLTLGGTRDLSWFRTHLHGTHATAADDDAATAAEHAVVVAVFTELFADEGIALRVV